MNTARLQNADLQTPAWVFDTDAITASLQNLANLRQRSGCKVLYSIKSLPLSAILETAKPFVDGFSASSLFEARLAREVIGDSGSLHLTTPGIKENELPELARLCSHISFNSLGQFQRLAGSTPTSVGLRINPKLAFVDDDRYNPCRKHSKLGADIDQVWQSSVFPHLRGLHVHSNFGAKSFAPLLETVAKIECYFKGELAKLDWLNLGGGYLFDEIADLTPFVDLSQRLRKQYGLEVSIEPGKAVVGKAGYLVATVIDLFTSDGKTIAVLDTSVNHQPEVFEYQWQPLLDGHSPNHPYPAQLVGNTCLAGDIFGDYRFAEPLQLGDRVIFQDVGAYSLVKASRFNGYNLPDIFLYKDNQIKPLKHYGYEEFRQQWLAN